MKYFIVNQKKTYKEESKGGYIWAPKVNKSGRPERHWESLCKVEPGDVIFSNYKGYIVSYNVAKGSCYDFNNPFESDDWKKDGRKVDLEYRILDKPIRYGDFIEDLYSLQGESGAFNQTKINQGYLFQLTKGQYKLIASKIEEYELIKDIDLKVVKEDSEELQDILDEIKQQEQVVQGKETAYSDEELKKLYDSRKNQKPVEQLKQSSRIKTDPKLKATCLRNHNYTCEIDSNHKTFMNTKNEHEYMESHHFIPIKAQKDFPELWLDDLFNLICLCPTCHAQFHYGSKDAKIAVFNKIYKLRKKELEEKGIDENKIVDILNEYYF